VRFLTTWLLTARREDAWDALADVLAWPAWWEGMEAATEVAAGDERRVGGRYRVRWRGRVPYAVEFDFEVEAVDQPQSMHGRASGGLVGTGHWRLFEQGGVTAVVYHWDVRPGRASMRGAAALAPATLRSNHDWVMRRGGEGLAARLECELLAAG
jgi:uncharacterized protein YndB with AHSA1/START domain